ncbi:MAG: carbohydrate ABC transporter permease [Clostridia bacterium]|nr:carbohydrate ABC transporter permease [Clostridia bacterium]PZN10625.1 MAG: carbohydrate ABC transporter permease [Caldicoprobacter oshimai]
MELALGKQKGLLHKTTETRHRKRTLNLYTLSLYGWAVVRGVIVIGLCFLILYPTILKVFVSFMSENDLYDVTVKYIPKNPTFENIKKVWTAMRYPQAFWNTLKISLMTSIMQLISCTFIGYGFARFNFKGKNLLFALVILTMIVPPQTIMIPLFLHFRYFDLFGIVSMLTGKKGINLLNSQWPFMLLSATGMGLKNGLYIYIMRQFFRGMPKELEEAAYVDGASMFRTFYQIMLPSAVPAMVTVFLFSFVWQWTDTFYSNLFLQNLRVLSVALGSISFDITQQIYWETGVNISLSPVVSSMYTNTASLLVILPLIVIYLVAQKYFVESIERTGIVG